MSKKDPAFLFYSQRWLEGTAEFSSSEKGVYVDLLAHQHQKGSLPPETFRLCRLTGLSEDEFLPIWEGIKSKFTTNSDNRLVNRTLNDIVKERSTKGLTNKITGTFASLIRSVAHLSQENIAFIKKDFRVTDYEGFDNQTATDRLTEWFHSRLKSIIDINRNIIKDSKGVEGEKKGFNTMPLFTDFNGLPEVYIPAIVQQMKFQKQFDITKEQILGMWEVFKIQNLTGKKYHPNEEDVYRYFGNWIKDKKFENGNNNTTGVANGTAKQGTSTARVNTAKNW